jgi:hypothetical protein
MTHLMADYIINASIGTPVIRYVWDDTRASSDFKYECVDLVEKLKNVSLRSRIALGIGVYEWIIERYRFLSDDPIPFQLAESAWCANIKKEHGEYVELNRSSYAGPIRGPLWCAVTWLLPMVYFSDENEDEWQSGIEYLVRLAMHVLPQPEIFEQWLNLVLDRLINMHPAPKDDPYEDIFTDHEEKRRGPLVAREALDPTFDYHPEDAPLLLDQFLRGVDYTNNPFLRSPEELKEAGIEHPYRVLPP